MSEESAPARQGDRLLWMLGGGVGVVGLLSFVLLNFGTGDDAREQLRSQAAASSDVSAGRTVEPPEGPGQIEDPFKIRLNRAQLALDAGMLIEPEGFSAWSLYSKILTEDPENAAAKRGLTTVADALVDDAFTAFGEGRGDAAQQMLAVVLERYPDHQEAANLRERIRQPAPAAATQPAAIARPSESAPAQRPAAAAPQGRPSQPPAVAVNVPRANPLAEMYPNFTRALADGALVEPNDASALHYLSQMRQLDAAHAMTLDAGQQLLDAVMQRFNTAFDGLDTAAAMRWLDAADRIGVDAERVATARQDVMNFVEAVAAAESIAASELQVLNYEAPSYPATAARRGIEGWVDVEFLLGKDGLPHDVTVTDASHESLFREEAVSAVSAWSFEPYRVMDHVVEQRAHTRIRFMLER